MDTENIQIVATARDLASAQINGLRKSIGSLGSKTGGPLGAATGGLLAFSPASLAAGAAVGALTLKLAQGVKSAIEEEKSLARLDTALANNVTGWNGNRDAIDDAIDARMNLGFEDDALRDSMIKLVVATKDQEEALRLQNLAMDVARGRNIDLASATDMVVKANMGNVGALRRMGIQIEKGADKAEILNELMRMFGGQAEEYAETTEGAMVAAGIAIDEAAESIGEALIPLIKDASIFVKDDLVPAFKDLQEVAGEMQPFFDGIHNLVNSSPGRKSGLDSLFPDLLPQGTIPALDEAAGKVQEFFKWLYRLTGTTLPGEEIFGPPTPPAEVLGPPTPAGIYDGFAEALNGEISPELDAHRRFVASQGRQIGLEWDENLADGLRGNKDVVGDAMKDLTFVMQHPMKLAKELARIEGALTGDKLREGLASENDAIRRQAEYTRLILEGQWKALTGTTYDYAVDVGQAATSGLNSQQDNIVNEAIQIRNAVVRALTGGGKVKIGVALGIANKIRNLPGLADGGPVTGGRSYIVGERGPEVFTPGQSGRIHPNGSGGPIVVNIDGRELFRIMDERMGKRLALSSSNAYVRG